MQERLQKIIARAGVASRRASEEIITAGRVRVNGHVITELGAKADSRADKIEIDGQRLIAEAPHYVVIHKARNVVSTLSDPEGRPTVGDTLRNAGARLYPVGRLDFATSGVLLATNDGDFANGLLHPRGGVPKNYVVKVHGLMQDTDLERWRTGVVLEDGKTLPTHVHFLRHEDDKTWFEITLREGRNQQIRRMGEATGFPVMRLARTSFAGITHEGLRPGEWRPLTVEELRALREEFGVPKRIRGAVTRAPDPSPGRGARGVLRPGQVIEARSKKMDREPRARANTPAGERASRGKKPEREVRTERHRGERPERAPQAPTSAPATRATRSFANSTAKRQPRSRG